MATTKAELILSATDQTKAAFASASRSLDGLSTSAAGFVGKFGGIAAVVAGATGAMAALQNIQAIKILDQLDDLAEKTGISVEKLSELRYAGEVTGTSFEALTSGIGRLAKQMAAAAGGNKEAAATFKALGVEVTNADGSLRSSDDVLRDVADRFSTYEDGAGKAALAQRLFGKSGADLIPILNQGGLGIKRLAEEATALGVIYDTKTAKAAAEFGDNLTKIRLASEAAAVSLAGPFIESLARVSGEMVEAKKKGVDYLAVLGNIAKYANPASQLVYGARMALGIGNEPAEKFKDSRILGDPGTLAEQIAKLPKGQAPVVKDDDKPTKTGRGGGSAKVEKDLEAAAKRYLETLDKQLEKTEKLSAVEIALAEIRRIGLEGGKVTEAMRQQIVLKAQDIDVTRKAAKTEEEFQNLLEKAAARRKLIEDEGARIMESVRTPLEAYNAELKKLNDLREAGAISAETQARAVQKESETYDEARKKAEEAANQQDEFAKRAAGNIQDSLGSGIADVLDGNYKSIGDEFRKMLNRMVAEAASAQISRQLFGDLVDGGEGDGLLSGGLKSLGLALGGGKKGNKGTDALDALLGSNGAFGTAGASVSAFTTSLAGSSTTTTTSLAQLSAAASSAAASLGGASSGDVLSSLAGLAGGGGGGYSSADQAALDALIGAIPSYAAGTDFVPEDMLANIHKGEKIIPAAQNKPGAGGMTLHLNQSFAPGASRQTTDQAAKQAAAAINRVLRNS